MKIAIIIFAYNRPDMIGKMLHSLKECKGIYEHDLYFFSDGPKNESDLGKVSEVRQIIKDFLSSLGINNAKIVCREKNMGLAKSVIAGVSDIINFYDGIICIEDDLILSHDFLTYMDGALERFKNDKRIWSVSGYCQDLKGLHDFDNNTFLSYRASSWGWGSWADRWNKIDWDVKDYKLFERNHQARKEFSRGGRDLPILLDYQMCGLIDSWAIRWCYAQHKAKMYTVYPVETRVEHIGCGKEATHVKKRFGKNQFLKSDHDPIDKFDVCFSDVILKQYRDYFKVSYVKSYIKLFLATKMGIRF